MALRCWEIRVAFAEIKLVDWAIRGHFCAGILDARCQFGPLFWAIMGSVDLTSLISYCYHS